MKNGTAPPLVVAVPIKDLTHVKQRLAVVLSAGQRSELARAMLGDVLRALAAAGLEHVWVVTRDPAAAAIARSLGAEPLAEAENRGHTAAVALAQAEATRCGARVFLTVPGDVPCVTAAELRQLAAAARDGAPALVPSRSGLGTNAVALTPPDAMPLTFGEPSFARHLATARARGLTPRVLTLPGLGLDIDAPDDLAALLAEGSGTETHRLVSTWRETLGNPPGPADDNPGPASSKPGLVDANEPNSPCGAGSRLSQATLGPSPGPASSKPGLVDANEPNSPCGAGSRLSQATLGPSRPPRPPLQ